MSFANLHMLSRPGTIFLKNTIGSKKDLATEHVEKSMVYVYSFHIEI
jgi:hypothetical protein